MTSTHEPGPSAEEAKRRSEDDALSIDAPAPDAEARFMAETDTHSRHTRVGWEVAAGVIAFALIAAGVGYALLDGDRRSSVEAPVPTSSPSSTAPTATQAPVTPSVVGTAVADATTGASPTPTQGAPAQPAPAGAPLAELTTLPKRTVVMLAVPKGFTFAAYRVRFKPYGWASGGQASGRIVVQVVSSEPINDSATSLDKDLVGSNLSVWCMPKVVPAIAVGGTYQGLLQVRPQGDIGMLYFSQAQLLK